MPKQHISIVIPAYNEESYIGPCLDALMKQTRQPDLIYIVDNNSTDNTQAIAKSYANVVVITETVQGICAATKKGLDVAMQHHGIILRCDADCRPNTDWVELTASIFDKKPDIVAITGPGVAYDTGRIARFMIDILYMRAYFTLIGFALGRPPLFGSNFGIRAEEWRRITHDTHLRTRQDIHDDIDISYHLLGKSLYKSTLQMPISARPFKSLHKLPRRYAAGFRSVFIHWPEHAPWNRQKGN